MPLSETTLRKEREFGYPNIYVLTTKRVEGNSPSRTNEYGYLVMNLVMKVISSPKGDTIQISSPINLI